MVGTQTLLQEKPTSLTQRVTLCGISWQTYTRLLEELGDQRTSPPPDLILEIDISSPSSRRFDIYKQLGVPEIWRYSGGNVHIYRLQDGEYVPSTQSLAFPLVSSLVINHFLPQAQIQDDTTFIRAWRQWVRQQVASEPS